MTDDEYKPTYRDIQEHYKRMRQDGHRVFGGSILLWKLFLEARQRIQLELPI